MKSGPSMLFVSGLGGRGGRFSPVLYASQYRKKEGDTMGNILSQTARRFQDTLESLGYTNQVVEFTDTTRTSEDAARAIGCGVEQIAKSLVFKTKKTEQPVLVIASGINRVDEKKVKKHLGEAVGKADADFVRLWTGFVIGGVPPTGHKEKIKTLIDEDLLRFEEIWAAAGTPNAVFKLTPEELVKMTGGEVLDLKKA